MQEICSTPAFSSSTIAITHNNSFEFRCSTSAQVQAWVSRQGVEESLCHWIAALWRRYEYFLTIEFMLWIPLDMFHVWARVAGVMEFCQLLLSGQKWVGRFLVMVMVGMIVGCMNVEFPRNYPPFSQLVWGWDDCWMYECLVPSKLSSIQSTRLRMRWLLGVWMLSYPPFSQLVWGWDDCWVYECWFTLHSVNSVEDGMIVGCMDVEFLWNNPPFSLLIWGWDDCWVYELLGWRDELIVEFLWNYPPFSQLEWGQTQSMDQGLTKFIFPFENIFSLSIESLFLFDHLLPHTSIPPSLPYLIYHQILKFLSHVYSRSLFMFPLNVAGASILFLYVLKYCPQSFLETK